MLTLSSAYPLKSIGPRVLKLCLPHLQEMIFGTVALLLGVGLNLFFPYFLREVLDGKTSYSIESDLGILAVILVMLFGLQAFVFYLRHYYFYAVGYKIVANLRGKLFSAIMSQEIGFFDRSRVGELMSRLSSDTSLLQRAVTINISVALRYALQVLGGVVMMLFLSIKLSLVVLVLLPLSIVGAYFWGKRLRAFSKSMQEELAEASVVAEESLGSIRTVRMFAGSHYEAERYQRSIASYLERGLERTNIAAQFSSTMVFVMHTSIAFILWYGGSLALGGSLSSGELTAFVLYGVIVAVSFAFLAGVWDEFMQAIGAAERIFELVDRKPQTISPQTPKLFPAEGPASVQFEGVGFSYPARPDIPVLEDISFEIRAGSSLALVGPSGSGKTTIASLIPRFYDPESGSVKYCSVDIRELDIQRLREDISIVQQNPQVFSLSLGENIRYGNLAATDEDVQKAAQAANIRAFIEGLPEGYNTLVGDKGVQLSAGQKQRVAIARALLKNPRFLILDEATSSLDSENEALVQQALNRLMEGRTSLIIAHRLSTVQHADRVLVIKGGRICQDGTHDTLVEQDGLYRTLVQHQLL